MPAPQKALTAGVEVELKFQLPAQHRARLQRALATKTAERLPLRALYFDTADRRLASAGLALRLRREGRRWVQTLKGRGDGLLQRLEDEVPLSQVGAAPPALDPLRHDSGTGAGQALARALAAGPAPELRFETDILRLRRVLRCEGARIEVALDVGEIRAGARRLPVCEVEFEWLSGPLSGLLTLAARWAARYRLVLDVTTKAERGHRLASDSQPPATRAQASAPSPEFTLGQARSAMVAAALAHALPNAAAVVGGAFNAEHVHQLRVALRRLRTVLRAFGPADAARDQALSALFAVLGRRRDADVRDTTLAPAWAAAAAAGLQLPQAGVATAAADAPAALRAPASTALWLALIALVHAPAADGDGQPWAAAAAPVLRRWQRRARRLARDWATLDDPARHRLRKQLKRLRYLLEFCAPLATRKSLRRQLAALRQLQAQLGNWNDLAQARRWLGAHAGTDPAAAFAAGWLAHAAQACDDECAAAAAAWRHVKAPRLR